MRKNAAYWQAVRRVAASLHSDGCSVVSELYHDCCLEHDIHYRTQRQLDGKFITRSEADKQFRVCMQSRSPFKWFSLVSWIRWAGVRIFGASSYGSQG